MRALVITDQVRLKRVCMHAMHARHAREPEPEPEPEPQSLTAASHRGLSPCR